MIPKSNRPPTAKSETDKNKFFSQVINKLKGFEKLQQQNLDLYSPPSTKFGDANGNGNESDQDILDNHIKSWDLESPGLSSPVPPVPIRRPPNLLPPINNNTPLIPPPYATMPRHRPSAFTPILPPKPTNEDKTIIFYKLITEEIQTKHNVKGRRPTLSYLKLQAKRSGCYRYFCKVSVRNGLDMFQEVIEDIHELPKFEDKVYCQMAEIHSGGSLVRSRGMSVEVVYSNQKSIYRFNILKTNNAPTLKEFKYCLPVLGNYR